MTELVRDWRAWLVFALYLVAIFLLLFKINSTDIDIRAAGLADPSTDRQEYAAQAEEMHYQMFVHKVEGMRVRQIADPPSLGERHKLRWAYKSVEVLVYELVRSVAGTKAALYVQYLHYALFATAALLFTVLSVRLILPAAGRDLLAIVGVAVFAYFAFLTVCGDIEETFTYIETAAIAAAIYFALRRQMVPFLIVLVVAVANRETGVAIGMIYVILNWRWRLFYLPLTAGPVLLVLFNLDLFIQPGIYDPANFLTFADERPNVFNLATASKSLLTGALLELLVILGPLALFVPRIDKDEMFVKLGLIGLMYLVILLFGTYIGNAFAYLLLVPPIICIAVLAFRPGQSVDRQ